MGETHVTVIYKGVNELISYVNNPRNNEAAVDKVASSIQEIGFKVPIIVARISAISRTRACRQ